MKIARGTLGLISFADHPKTFQTVFPSKLEIFQITQRDGILKKTAVLLDFVQITFRPSLQFAKLVQLFSDVKIKDLKVSFEMKTLCILYTYILK